MSKLEKSLQEWRSKNLITTEQIEEILSYEASKQSSSWIMLSLLILGAAIIGIGIISLVAANWDLVPPAVKLTNNFLLLGLCVFFLKKFWAQKQSLRYEALLCLYIILCLASIGLIAQIFHTGGKLYQALLFWSIITFAPVLTAQHFFVPLIWSGAFLTSLANALGDEFFYGVMAAATLFSGVLAVIFKTMSHTDAALTKAFRYWTIIGGFLTIFGLEIEGSYLSEKFLVDPLILIYSFTGFILLSLYLSKDYRKIQKICLSICLLLFLLQQHIPLFKDTLNLDRLSFSLIIAILTIFILALMAIYMVTIKSHKLFQLFLSFIGIRFLILYFQAIGGLAYTGVGLIISGVLVITTALAWNKYRLLISQMLESWVQK